MDEKQQKIAELFKEAGGLHHKVYRIVDGDHNDWASWYADRLLDLSELPELLGKKPVRSHMIHALVTLDREITEKSIKEHWPEYYAKRLPELLP